MTPDIDHRHSRICQTTVTQDQLTPVPLHAPATTLA